MIFRRLVGVGVFFAMLCLSPAEVSARSLNGAYLEQAGTLNDGAWALKSYVELGSKAKPIKVTNAVTGTGDVELKTGTIRLPVELRYGLTDKWELGGDLGLEIDNGGIIVGSKGFLDGSGLQGIRMYGKWNFIENLATKLELSFAGDESLYWTLGSFDLGIKFMFSPEIGPGQLNTNLGFVSKSGDVSVSSALVVDFGTMFMYGVGYTWPWGDRIGWTVELAGSSSPYKGGTGVSGKNARLSLLFGGQYELSERVSADASVSFGLAKGSPRFMLKGGMEWLWGAVEEARRTAAAATPQQPSKAWTPSTTPAGAPATGATTAATPADSHRRVAPA